MCWRRRLLAAVAVPSLLLGLACIQDPDAEDHTPTVEDSQYLDWDLTAQWPTDIPRQNPFSAGVLTADGTRLLLSYGAQGGRGLTVLDVSRHGELLVYAEYPDIDIQLFRAEVHGDQLWTINDGNLKLWDIGQVDLQGAILVQDHAEIRGVYDVEVVGDVVYVGTFEGLYAYDRAALETAPRSPDDAIGFAPTVGAINDYTVIAQGAEWLWLGGFEGKALFDVSDPTNPTFQRSLGDRSEQAVLMVGDLLCSQGVTWDVSDPHNPAFVTRLPFTYGYQALLTPTVAVSSSEGLVWTDFAQDPPVEVRRIPTTGQFKTLSNGEAIFGIDDFVVYRVEGP